MRKRYKVDQEQLERLKTAVEQFISFPLSTPYDYERLSETIKLEGCGYVSATTLKRIWGYINDTGCGYSPSAYSLRTLCNLLGFKDMDEFAGCPVPIQSREYMGDFVESCRRMPNSNCAGSPTAAVCCATSPTRSSRCSVWRTRTCMKGILWNADALRNKRLPISAVCFAMAPLPAPTSPARQVVSLSLCVSPISHRCTIESLFSYTPSTSLSRLLTCHQ